MSKYIIPLFLLICIMVLGVACHECKLAQDLRFTDAQKAQNPFNGYEKLIYKTGDSTVEFTGAGRENMIIEYDISQSSCDWGLEEIDELRFKNNFYEISLRMSDRHDFKLFLFDKSTDISLMSMFNIESNPENNSDYDEFIDSLNVDGGLFFNIYKDHLFSPYDFPDSLNHAVNLYYSIEYGIVKFDFSDGSTWELKEIVW